MRAGGGEHGARSGPGHSLNPHSSGSLLLNKYAVKPRDPHNPRRHRQTALECCQGVVRRCLRMSLAGPWTEPEGGERVGRDPGGAARLGAVGSAFSVRRPAVGSSPGFFDGQWAREKNWR